jgi:hypothetical protein
MKTRIKVTKTYKGNVELRDYDVREFIKNGDSIEIQLGKDVMTLSTNQLENNIVSKSKLFPSKMGGKSYTLYGYVWEPDEIDL